MGKSKDLASGETRFVNTAGDTMSGDLGINGDLTVDTNALFVDASANKVGINTTTLNNALNVESASYTALGIKRNTGVTTGTGELGIHMETNSQTTVCYDDEGSFVFGTAGTPSTAAGFSEKVRIDSSGRVTMPSQPYFAAEMTGNGNYQSRSQTTALPFNSVRMNTVSGSYDGSNYRYTAPVSGKYLMIAGGITNQANPTGRLQFYVNGSNEYTGQGSSGIKYGINGSNTAGGGSCLTSAIIPMNANDYVDVRSSSGATNFYEDNHSFWTGMLLG